MREIVPFYKEPRTPENLIDALSFGTEIEKGVIDFDTWTGRVSEVKEDGEIKGTVIFLPFLDAEELFDEVLKSPAPESNTEEEEEEEGSPAQTATLRLANGKEVRLALVSTAWGVVVRAVDRDGIPLSLGNLIEFSTEGCVYRTPGVSSAFGFQQDVDGSIKEG